MNKKDIEIIFKQAKKYYLETENVSIKLKFTPLYYSTMTSRPKISSFLFPWKKHQYVVNINSFKKTKTFSVPITYFNDSILLGWFGHELAHITQYEKMKTMKFLIFPFLYIFNKKFRRKFEIEADNITKKRGLEKKLVEGIKFIIQDPRVSNAYKIRTKKFYSSVDI